MEKEEKRGEKHVRPLYKGGASIVMPPFPILGIDPGNFGAIVSLPDFHFWKMPIVKIGKSVQIDFLKVRDLLRDLMTVQHVFLERAVAFGMGTTSAFNYGRGFAAIEHALISHRMPYTLVEPAKWTSAMHAGTARDWKAKARSLAAVHRLYPREAQLITRNRNGKMDEGVVDALLIAGYGMRQFGGAVDPGDFY